MRTRIITGSAKLVRDGRGGVVIGSDAAPNRPVRLVRRTVLSLAFAFMGAAWCHSAGAWVALEVGHTLDKPGASSARGRVEFGPRGAELHRHDARRRFECSQ